jgi:hypothetical protein
VGRGAAPSWQKQKATKDELVREQRQARAAMDKLLAKCDRDPDQLKAADKREWDAIQERMSDVFRRLGPLQAQPRFAGFVWVHLRKPGTKAAEADARR